MTTDATRAPPRRDPKDIILHGLYVLLFAIAGVTCLMGILFLRSGLRIAEPASTTSIVRRSAPLAPPPAVSDQQRPVPVVRRMTMPQARAPSGNASR